jgi:hypothetical protein
MRTNFSRTVWMQFPSKLNENEAPNVSGLLTLAQSQLGFRHVINQKISAQTATFFRHAPLFSGT